MGLFGKKLQNKSTKLFFVTDVHGSETTFRKFVNAGKFYGVNALILGGDIAGKFMVPILDLGHQKYRATIQNVTHELLSAEDVVAFESRAAKLGYYCKIVTPNEYTELAQNEQRADDLYHEVAAERLVAWIKFAEERLEGTGIKCYLTGGNDDSSDVLDIIERESHSSCVACEDKVVELDDEGHLMLSLGLSNPTPWKTPREVSEEELATRIERMVEGIDDFSRVIFNLHAPPVDSTLDTCARLDDSTDPPTVITAGGAPIMYGAGSKAVREAIERYQPMVSLHGHIHEARGQVRIGRTIAINPGSEYGEGILRGCIVTLDGDTAPTVQLTSG
jgi:uncharacterized protein